MLSRFCSDTSVSSALTFVVVDLVFTVALERKRAVVAKPAPFAAALPLILERQLWAEGAGTDTVVT